MSRLNEMLRELCPEGVEYRPLKDLCKIKEKETITKGDLIDGGKHQVINSSREILGYYSRCNNEGDTLVLTSHGAHAGFVTICASRFLRVRCVIRCRLPTHPSLQPNFCIIC